MSSSTLAFETRCEGLTNRASRVPLDYSNPSLGNASLALARYLATDKTSRQGTLLTNPGGTGGSGVNYIYRAGKRISEVLEGKFDIVSIIRLF